MYKSMLNITIFNPDSDDEGKQGIVGKCTFKHDDCFWKIGIDAGFMTRGEYDISQILHKTNCKILPHFSKAVGYTKFVYNDMPKFANIIKTVKGDSLTKHINAEKDMDKLFDSCRQLFFALHFGQKYAKFYHNDLHSSNVIMKPTKNDYHIYHVNSEIYIVPTNNLCPVIIDYGYSYSEYQQKLYFSLEHTNRGYITFAGHKFGDIPYLIDMLRTVKNTRELCELAEGYSSIDDEDGIIYPDLIEKIANWRDGKKMKYIYDFLLILPYWISLGQYPNKLERPAPKESGKELLKEFDLLWISKFGNFIPSRFEMFTHVCKESPSNGIVLNLDLEFCERIWYLCQQMANHVAIILNKSIKYISYKLDQIDMPTSYLEIYNKTFSHIKKIKPGRCRIFLPDKNKTFLGIITPEMAELYNNVNNPYAISAEILAQNGFYMS